MATTTISGAKLRVFLSGPPPHNVLVCSLEEWGRLGGRDKAAFKLLDLQAVKDEDLKMSIQGESVADVVAKLDGNHLLLWRRGTAKDRLEETSEDPFAAMNADPILTEEADGDLGGDDSPIRAVDAKAKLHPEWRQISSPTQIPAHLEALGTADRSVREIAEAVDKEATWLVCHTSLRLSSSMSPHLSYLPSEAAKPTDPAPRRFNGDQLNTILRETVGGDPNFQTFTAPKPNEGWEEVYDHEVRLPKAATVTLNGSAQSLGDLINRSEDGVRWAHRKDTPWDRLERVKKGSKTAQPKDPGQVSDRKAWDIGPRMMLLLFILAVPVFWVLGHLFSNTVAFVFVVVIWLAALSWARKRENLEQRLVCVGLGVTLLFALLFLAGREIIPALVGGNGTMFLPTVTKGAGYGFSIAALVVLCLWAIAWNDPDLISYQGLADRGFTLKWRLVTLGVVLLLFLGIPTIYGLYKSSHPDTNGHHTGNLK